MLIGTGVLLFLSPQCRQSQELYHICLFDNNMHLFHSKNLEFTIILSFSPFPMSCFMFLYFVVCFVGFFPFCISCLWLKKPLSTLSELTSSWAILVIIHFNVQIVL